MNVGVANSGGETTQGLYKRRSDHSFPKTNRTCRGSAGGGGGGGGNASISTKQGKGGGVHSATQGISAISPKKAPLAAVEPSSFKVQDVTVTSAA